jgi:hypothetical protein
MNTNGQRIQSTNGNGSSNGNSSYPWSSGYPYPTYEKGYWDGYRTAGQDLHRPKHDWSEWPYRAFAVTFYALLFICLYMHSYYRDQRDKVWDLNHLTDNQTRLLLSEEVPQGPEDSDDDPDDDAQDYTSPYLW